MIHALLIEIGLEELPPKGLGTLGQRFAAGVVKALTHARIEFDQNSARALYAPRRLAVRVDQVAARQPDRNEVRLGPYVAHAFAEDGSPKPAALGFARSNGVDVDRLERSADAKGERLCATVHQAGVATAELLPGIIDEAVKDLPIPKPMRWGSMDRGFVRPVHWMVCLLDNEVVPGEWFGQSFGRTSRGHRVHQPRVEIDHASNYEALLEAAFVLVDPSRRHARVLAQAKAIVSDGNVAQLDDALVDEVASLLEWPVAVLGTFDASFLQVPAAVLVEAMQVHQRFFPVRDVDGELQPQFIAFANLESADVAQVRAGFQRVIQPRLEDARFFYEQDLKTPLADHQATLKQVVYQRELGTVWEKCERVAALARHFADDFGVDATTANTAASLMKCDLATMMVDEFPSLQGHMGAHYHRIQGGNPEVASAIEQHYWPRFAGDQIPAEALAKLLALVDRIDTIVGIFAVGLAPTGNKDPFALRRAALGVVRLLFDNAPGVALRPIWQRAIAQLPAALQTAELDSQVHAFLLDRLVAWLRDRNTPVDSLRAVLAVQDDDLADIRQRLTAIAAFRQQPEAASLAAANKRCSNLLSKADAKLDGTDAEYSLAAERTLADALKNASAEVKAAVEIGDFARALSRSASLKEPVDVFFDEVMVMSEDDTERQRRLALLFALRETLSSVADISKLEL